MRAPHDAYWAINAIIRSAKNLSKMFSLTISTAIVQPREGLFAQVSRNLRIAPFNTVHCCIVSRHAQALDHWSDTQADSAHAYPQLYTVDVLLSIFWDILDVPLPGSTTAVVPLRHRRQDRALAAARRLGNKLFRSPPQRLLRSEPAP